MAGEFTLRKQGIDPHNDLELIQNIDFANIASAYASGTGDYVQLFEPQASIHHLKAGSGGLRTWGEHFRSTAPTHSAGDYYFAMLHVPPANRGAYFRQRWRKTLLTRYDLMHPWWIPLKAIRELRAMQQARARRAAS